MDIFTLDNELLSPLLHIQLVFSKKKIALLILPYLTTSLTASLNLYENGGIRRITLGCSR